MKLPIFAAVVVLGFQPSTLFSQTIPSGLSQGQIQSALNNPNLSDRIRQQIQSSGLTADQIRSRLAAAGYSQNLLDSYIGSAAPGATDTQPTQDVYAALSALGVGPTPVQGLEGVPLETGVSRTGIESVSK